ncbi:peptidyl-prolyl cis-trans isomerase [Streptomyces sp. NBC_01518]|uniref:peptidyl-prolyl cis-trans isomerase n=1 Tax=Streptomyces sp. NBC_01518 TaxID=2903891 RepID=UPI0038703CEB
MTEHAAVVRGRTVPKRRVDALLAAVPARDRESTRPEALARAERQRRRWATQVVVIDELAQRACAERGLEPPDEVAPDRVLAVAETDVADLGSIVAAALAHSPAARLLLAELEGEQEVTEADVREYYDRNPDRFLTTDALRRGVDPFGGASSEDFVPYGQARVGVARELRQAAGRRAFFGWLDQAKAGVVYAVGHEHPGDPAHPDHEHRH